ncbi:hypothetical protein TIFTF001_034400 [Ficus carica]|uniref:Uncharacterized protein n=1 Tax=Ficus carica TaxID=3494 RepID=A0AA88E0F7_FICCA|nr:hypothetical protein TIFTF001_034400 [Ficus carica]
MKQLSYLFDLLLDYDTIPLPCLSVPLCSFLAAISGRRCWRRPALQLRWQRDHTLLAIQFQRCFRLAWRRSTPTLVLFLPSTIGGLRSMALRGVENDEMQKFLRATTIDGWPSFFDGEAVTVDAVGLAGEFAKFEIRSSKGTEKGKREKGRRDVRLWRE